MMISFKKHLVYASAAFLVSFSLGAGGFSAWAQESAAPMTQDNSTAGVEQAAPVLAPLVASPVSPPVDDLSAPISDELKQATADRINNTDPVFKMVPVEENIYYDSDALVPNTEMTEGAPRKVNPRYEPASSLVVVTKDHNGDSRTAQIVAAERAVKLGRYESALEIYTGLLSENKSKSDPNVLLGRASSLQQLGRYDEAILAYEEVLTLRPNLIEAQINMLGLMSQKYPSVALRRLLDLRQEYPSHPGVAAQIAVTQANLGQYAEAVQYLGVAAGIEPENPNHIYNMAVISDRAGQRDDAVKYYEQALEVDTIYGGSRHIPRDSVYERLSQLR